MPTVESLIAIHIRLAAERILGGPWPGEVQVEVSNRPDLGDYASSVAFALAKLARRAPFDIAKALAAELAPDQAPAAEALGRLIERATAAAPGFLNIRLAPAFLDHVIAESLARGGRIADSEAGEGIKVVIEHTNINPNKAAHVGHFRNACIGDTVARVLQRLGYGVEVQNYIDDTGVQVADVVVGLRHLDRLDVPPQGDRSFDRYCSDVYVAVQGAYAADPALSASRTAVQHAIEHGEGELAAFARDVTGRIAAANLATMARAGITYDLLTWESAILRLGFWQHAFGMLRAKGVIRCEESGPNAGCWVVPFGQGTVEVGDKTVSEDKVLVTSRGIATYTAKDIAYQLWKFGLLGLDFGYKPLEVQADGRPLWTGTADLSDSDPTAPEFAHGDHVINVIDVKQSYLQQVVYDCLRRMGFDEAADHSEHLNYAFVTLSAASARELGVELDEDATQVAMSGRQGIQVFADELVDRLILRLSERVQSPSLAEAIAVSAARYYMLKFSNNQPIAFDFEDALRTTGETGVYLLYAYVRASGILRRLSNSGDPGAVAVAASPIPADPPSLDRTLVLKMAEYPRILAATGQDRTVQGLARYAFELATAFNSFYDNTTPVLQESDADLKAWRITLVVAFRFVMHDVLEVLGIPTVEQI